MPVDQDHVAGVCQRSGGRPGDGERGQQPPEARCACREQQRCGPPRRTPHEVGTPVDQVEGRPRHGLDHRSRSVQRLEAPAGLDHAQAEPRPQGGHQHDQQPARHLVGEPGEQHQHRRAVVEVVPTPEGRETQPAREPREHRPLLSISSDRWMGRYGGARACVPPLHGEDQRGTCSGSIRVPPGGPRHKVLRRGRRDRVAARLSPPSPGVTTGVTSGVTTGARLAGRRGGGGTVRRRR